MKIIDFTTRFLHEFPGCPDSLARVAVVLATQKLCKDGGPVWSEWLDEISLQAGQRDYELEPTLGIIDSVTEVWTSKERLSGQSLAEINRLLPHWRVSTGSSPLYFNMDGPVGTLSIYPTPADGIVETIRVKVSLFPALSSTSIPDDLANNHGDVIEKGARSRLFLTRGQTWSDAKLGVDMRKEFESDIVDVRIDTENANVPANNTVLPRAFG